MDEGNRDMIRARMAEKMERYDDMVKAMKTIAKRGMGLTEDERDLLSVAYKNLIGSRRLSWRTVTILEIKEKEKMREQPSIGDKTAKLMKTYRREIEAEMKGICEDILKLLDDKLLPSVNSQRKNISSASEQIESKVFYYKMKGDYLRYLAEFTMGNERKEAAENSLLAYKAATDYAGETLHPSNATRLGLALNFSIFYYEILNSPTRACKLAQQALEEACGEMDDLTDDKFEDSAIIMQLMKDNIGLWTADMQKETVDGQQLKVEDFM